jgi:hypothetical protein
MINATSFTSRGEEAGTMNAWLVEVCGADIGGIGPASIDQSSSALGVRANRGAETSVPGGRC